MGKTRRGNKEFTREQKLVNENKRLKRELAQLRKELARLDLDRYENIKEMIQETYQDDKAKEGQEILDNLKKTWACRESGCNGYLEIMVFSKMGEPWYLRKCNACPHRTKAQKYDPGSVKGILRK